MGVDLVTLPGGFFQVRSVADRDAMSKRISSEAVKLGIAVAVGIDIKHKQHSLKGQGKKLKTNDGKRHEKLIRKQKLPSFAVCWSRKSGSHCWPQRSTNHKDQDWVSDEVCNRSQLISVKNRFVAVLECGEVFNKRIREAIINQRTKVTAVVDLAHVGKGLRINPALRSFGECGVFSFCSAHVNRKNAMKRGFNSRGGDISSRENDINVPRKSPNNPESSED